MLVHAHTMSMVQKYGYIPIENLVIYFPFYFAF